MKLLSSVKQTLATIAAVGAVKRGGLGALRAYPGKIEGKVVVTCNKTGKKTEGTLSGGVSELNI